MTFRVNQKKKYYCSDRVMYLGIMTGSCLIFCEGVHKYHICLVNIVAMQNVQSAEINRSLQTFQSGIFLNIKLMEPHRSGAWYVVMNLNAFQNFILTVCFWWFNAINSINPIKSAVAAEFIYIYLINSIKFRFQIETTVVSSQNIFPLKLKHEKEIKEATHHTIYSIPSSLWLRHVSINYGLL